MSIKILLLIGSTIVVAEIGSTVGDYLATQKIERACLYENIVKLGGHEFLCAPLRRPVEIKPEAREQAGAGVAA